MKRTAALRITGDICFYYTILSLFDKLTPWRLAMACFVLACLLVGLLATGVRSAPLRVLLSLLPGACFLLGDLRPLMVFPALPWLYFVLYMGIGRFGMTLSDYRTAFRWMLLGGAVIIAVCTVSAMLYGSKTVPVNSMAYLVLYLLLGVFAMRRMQMGSSMEMRWQAVNLLTVLAALILAVGVSLVAYQLYAHSMPVLLFITAPLRVLLRWLFGLFRTGGGQIAPSPTPTPENPIFLFPGGLTPVQSASEIVNEEPERVFFDRLPDQMLSLAGFLIMAFLVFIAAWLIIKLVRRGVVPAEEAYDYEATEAYTPKRGRRKAKTPAVHGRAQTVRMLYREYLDYLKDNGLTRSPSDTSEEILAESARISDSSAREEETLRSVYLKARYSAAAVTDEDVAAARASLAAIRGRDKARKEQT